jgi:hypothetical protein
MSESIFPEIKLFRPVIHFKRLGEFLLGIHDLPNTGAAPMLDQALDCPDEVAPPDLWE